VDIVFHEFYYQFFIFNASYAMTYPGWTEKFQGFPYAICPPGFTRVGRTVNTMCCGIPECFNMIGNRKPRFIARDIKSYNSGSCKTFNEVNGFPALLFCKMPEGAKDHANFHTGVYDAFSHGI